MVAGSTAPKAAARLKQLSCLGLAREIAIPEMLRELHALVPSYANTFHFADAGGEVDNIYFENTDLVKFWPLYQREVFERPREREFRGLAFSDASKRVYGVHELVSVLEVDPATFHKSDYYNLVVRPVGYASNFLRLYFRRNRRVLGGLTVWRAPTATAWSPQDKRRLAALESFFVHAVTAAPAPDDAFVDSLDRGLIVADATGKAVYLSAEGRRLLFLATHPRTVKVGGPSGAAVLPPPVARLCEKLARLFAGATLDSPPVYRCSNVWGGFTFRAEWLDRDQPGSGLVGIVISHEVPLPVRLSRGVARLALSRRQAEVCVLLAAGASLEAIAGRLGISRHTAGEHGRWIYNKLDVHTRADLVKRVLVAG
jgi:DNA-binding CsgD family transcriptional regulator